MSVQDPVLARIQAGDEAAFAALIDEHSPMMLRLAGAVVPREFAEEVVQEAWLAALEGLHAFEGRSSLSTWLGQIVLNRGRTHSKANRRNVSLDSSAADEGDGWAEVDLLLDAQGHWREPATGWGAAPDSEMIRLETAAQVHAALANLPETQRLVVTLRDLEGLSSTEACHILGLSETNQRQLLHRGRLRLRRALEAARER